MQVRFKYQPPTAGKYEVGILGDFTGWKIFSLHDAGGVYLIDFELKPGRYVYKFIVNGIWQKDFANHLSEPDPFGGENSILIVKEKKRAKSFAQSLSWAVAKGYRDLIRFYRMGEESWELRFYWQHGFADEVKFVMDKEEIGLEPFARKEDMLVWQAVFSLGTDALYQIRIKNEDNLWYLGEGGFSKELNLERGFSLKLCEYPIFTTPEWLKHSICYQIFTDRFYNGRKELNQDFEEEYYKHSREKPPKGEYLKPYQEYFHFVEDWYDIKGLKQSEYQKEGVPDWWSFYGGDIPGVLKKLDYLCELGVNLLYFNPLWEAKSNHKYDAVNFAKIDPHFGNKEELKALADEAHKRGMRLILDVAFNHSGEHFWAFKDTVEKGRDSKYWHWYDWAKWPLPEPLPEDFKPRDYYQCWWGIKDMPDLNFDLSRKHPYENYIRDINSAKVNWELVNHILHAASWWIREIGFDGFRLDVPDEVPWWFWELFRQKIKEIKPDAWLVGEIWYNAEDWANEKYFDSVMNYAFFKDPLIEYFLLGLLSKESFCKKIEEGLASYPLQALKAMMNLLGSHDTIRIMELAKGELFRLKMAVFFQMTFIGVPHIYYGDEIATPGGKDPDNRRPFNWRWKESGQAIELRDFYQKLIAFRKNSELLKDGGFSFVESGSGLLVYKRFIREKSLLMLINGSEEEQVFEVEDKELLFSEGKVDLQEKTIVLSAKSLCIIDQ